MTDKYIYINDGVLTEKVATVTSTGASEAGKIIALDGTGKIDNSILPTGLGAETDLIVCSENLSAGDFVNVFNSSGTAKVRRADASTIGKEATGFVLSAYTSGQTATVYRGTQLNSQLTSLTPGTKYFLSDVTPGGIVSTVPIGTGKTVQVVGYSKSATELIFNPLEPIILA